MTAHVCIILLLFTYAQWRILYILRGGGMLSHPLVCHTTTLWRNRLHTKKNQKLSHRGRGPKPPKHATAHVTFPMRVNTHHMHMHTHMHTHTDLTRFNNIAIRSHQVHMTSGQGTHPKLQAPRDKWTKKSSKVTSPRDKWIRLSSKATSST